MQTFFTKGQASFHIMIKHALWYAHADIGYAQLSAKKCVEIASKVKKCAVPVVIITNECNSQQKIKKTNEKFDQLTHIAHILCMGGGIFDPKKIVPYPRATTRLSALLLGLHSHNTARGAPLIQIYFDFIFELPICSLFLFNERLLHSVIAF
jgi:hypothetical protein